MSESESRLQEREVARLAAFTDGVIIVAMTLLVLDIRLPGPAVGLDGQALLEMLKQVFPKTMGYAISFLVIGLFWMGNVRRFRRLARIDTGLIWLTLFFLLSIGVIPFVTSVMSDNPGVVGTQLYASVLAIASLFSGLIGWHARRKGLFDPAPPAEFARLQMRALLNLGVFGSSIVVAQFSPDGAKLLWTALIPASAILERTWARRDKRAGAKPEGPL
jgi:uncharacterized membrane protein